MNLSEAEILKRLGSGDRIASVCEAANLSRPEFDRWWQETIARRVPPAGGQVLAEVSAKATIERDDRGIPHIFAESDADLFFAFGYAMAGDRLYQLDYLRRKGMGRLSEVLGADGLELDTIARTVGLNRIAAAEWDRLSGDVRGLIESFTDGINALIESTSDNLPIEFDLLGYRPEPWTPIDCLAIESEFRWYLTGRFPIIVIPELAKRALGEGPLYNEFVLGEQDEESILWQGEYPFADPGDPRNPLESVGQSMSDPESATGSNNWVISGRRTTTGQPLLGSDPHIAFEAVSCWYEAHLCGGSFNVAGMAYAGIPAIMFGRNEKVAWGITNNICSQRDLYQEKTDAEHPGCFQYEDAWEPAHELTEVIQVADAEPVRKTIRFSRNGPVVDEILPPPANAGESITLKWLGAHHGGWLTAMLDMDRAGNLNEFRETLRPWHVPTFSLVIADVDGQIGFQTSGRIPVRESCERGYRPGWDLEHQWQGLIPFEDMPFVVEPERGWVGSANNRLAGEDYLYPLFGRWSSGWRATRIRQMIEGREKHSPADLGSMHQDAMSLRAADLVPALVAHFESNDVVEVQAAIQHLKAWDFRSLPDSVGTTIFNVFFTQWSRTVANERFSRDAAELMANGCHGCAARLLKADEAGWFAEGQRDPKINETFHNSLMLLTDRLGPEMSEWTWGRLHTMRLGHVLSTRGDLNDLLDHGGASVRGDMTTVCNTGAGPNWTATTGAGYRMIADLSSSPPKLMAVDAQSQSGHPGSKHYSDQLDDWITGSYHELPLDRKESSQPSERTFALVPR
jgi:penicillin amidase